MDNINLKKHGNEFEEYLKIGDYTKAVLNNFSDVSKLDSNDIYDIVYAKKIIEANLKTDIENKEILCSMQDMLKSINTIINLLSDDIVKSAINNKINSRKIKDTNKKRLDDTVKDVSDISKPKKKPVSPINFYIKKNISKLVFVAIAIFVLTKISSSADNWFVDTSVSNETQEDSNVTVDSINKTDALKLPVSDYTKDDAIVTAELLILVIKSKSLIVLIVTTFSLILDMMYIALQSIRDITHINNNNDTNGTLFSPNAIEAVELSLNSPFEDCGYEKADSNSRISVSRALLNNMKTLIDNNSLELDDSVVFKINDLYDTVNNNKDNLSEINSLIDAEFIYSENTTLFKRAMEDNKYGVN